MRMLVTVKTVLILILGFLLSEAVLWGITVTLVLMVVR
jgi:hypothetical protein